jgi:L-asparagine transporter-like permease
MSSKETADFMTINRTALYSALIVGGVGTLFLWQMARLDLATGWWCGVGIGVVNFTFLISSIRKAQEPQAAGQNIRVPRRPFFLRYVGLAFIFFLVLQLGQEQFGSALLAFATYYIVMLIDYVIRLRKKKAS